MKKHIHEILEAFLPAMEKIQSSSFTDDEKKRKAKDWLRKQLEVLLLEHEAAPNKSD